VTTSSLSSEEQIAGAIREHLGSRIEAVRTERRSRLSVLARVETLRDVATWLKDFGFDHTMSVSGVDHLAEKRIEVVYFLSSYSLDNLKHIALLLKVDLNRDNPSLPSLTPIWESANLFEREACEMFGINFEGHPDQRKLLLQDNWDGPPPMRKDLKIPELA
jgi:NADH-quinone oxidoreductase subunit C